jgi:hypothetical protein
LTSALVGGDQLHARPALTLGKSPRCPFDRRLGRPQIRSGRYEEVKTSDPTGTQLRSPNLCGTKSHDYIKMCNWNRWKSGSFLHIIIDAPFCGYRIVPLWYAIFATMIILEPHGVTTQKTPFFILSLVQKLDLHRN